MRLPGEIAREEYEAHPGVRWSQLTHMRKSPLHYRHAVDSGAARQTPALRTGSALHTAIFEPECWDARFTVYRDSKTRGAGARKNWEAFQEEANEHGLTILDPEEESRALGCAAAIAKTGATRYLAPSRGRAEIPLTWRDQDTGLLCKMRADWVTLDCVIVDLKSTRSGELRAFGRQAWHLGYFHQAHFYAMGLAAAMGRKASEIPFLFIAVETEPPHDVSLFEPCDETRYAAEEEVKALMGRLAECQRTGKRPGRYEGVQVLKAPAYVLMSEDEDWQTTITEGGESHAAL